MNQQVRSPARKDLDRIHKAQAKRERRRLRNVLNEAAQGNWPDGVRLVKGHWVAECSSCERDYRLCYDLGDFHPDSNYCGRSDRCIP